MLGLNYHFLSRGIHNITHVFIIIAFFLSACNSNNEKKSHHQIKIVTTTGMIYDAVKNIVGDSAEVSRLMGPGVDPHLYKSSFGDLRKLRKANIIVYNGLHLEGKMVDVFERLANQKTTIAAGVGLRENELRKSTQFNGNPDPHIWFNVHIWRQAVEHIGMQLMKADASRATFYKGNLTTYLNKLDVLDNWVKNEIHTIPKQKRVLVTAHDAFGYFGDAYSIEVRGLQGISTLADFGLNDISSLVNLLSERKIKAVFVESSVPRKAIDAVVEGCRDKGHKVSIGGTLYSDAMGAEGTPEDNYIGMVTYNVNAIVKALK